MSLLITIIITFLLLASIGLQKAYSSTPLQELKKRARTGDELAALLYSAAGYGSSLRAALTISTSALAALLFLRVVQNMSATKAFFVVMVLVWVTFTWLPASKVNRITRRLAASLAQPIAWLLGYLHPLLSRATAVIKRHRPVTIHTGLYDKQDFLDLLDRQRIQTDNRVDKQTLSIARHALRFNERLVRERLVPRRVVKSVAAEETVGPVLMSELHDSGHSRFPVFDGKKDNIVGILYIKDLIDAKQGGEVRKLMRARVSYIHEDQTLFDALQAIIKTHQQLLIVVNTFEEYVGVLSVEDVVEDLIGADIIDEFDQYHDLRAVAERAAKKDHAKHNTASSESEGVS
jgi:CBS domain containing-hemolysin-like protein